MTTRRFAALLGLCALAACADADRAVFVTDTSIGVNGDAMTRTASFGYDRTEGYVGPTYVETGSTPAVFGYIASDLAVFDASVKQLYATGVAADWVTRDTAPAESDVPHENTSGERRVMLFGTTNSIGFKVGFAATSGLSDSVALGYKRREASVIPLRSAVAPGMPDAYASTLASIEMGEKAATMTDSGVRIAQFIATGTAANNLARQAYIRGIYRTKAETAVDGGERFGRQTMQRAQTLGDCVTGSDGTLDRAKLAAILDRARSAGLLNDGQTATLGGATTPHDLQFRIVGAAQGAAAGLNALVAGDQSLCVQR